MMKKLISLSLVVSIVLLGVMGCGENTDTSSSEKRILTQEEKNMLYGDWRRYSRNNEQNTTIEVAEPTDEVVLEERELTQKEKDFMYGKWRMQTFLGHSIYYSKDIISDDNTIGKIITIESDYYSSMELSEYDIYPCEFTDPVYKINRELNNDGEFYMTYKIADDTLKISYNDKIKSVYVKSPTKDFYADHFLIINDERLIYFLGDGEIFELEKVE